MELIEWQDFTKIELRVGTIIAAEAFKQARVPAYIVTVDFGSEIGIKKSSAQITHLYTTQELINKQIIGVVNLPIKQIGPLKSEFLITGFYSADGVVLAVPERQVNNGEKIG